MSYSHGHFLRFPAFFLLLFVGLVCAHAAIEQKASQPRDRLAIVIGNSGCRSSRLEHLPNADNDATRLAESLKRLNFDALTGTDFSAEGFPKLFRESDAKLETASAALIFYARRPAAPGPDISGGIGIGGVL